LGAHTLRVRSHRARAYTQETFYAPTGRTYDSVDEMPAEIRQIYERIQRERMK